MENKKEKYQWDIGRKIMWSLVAFFVLFIVFVSIVGTKMDEQEKQTKIEEMKQKQKEKVKREKTEEKQKYAVKKRDSFNGEHYFGANKHDAEVAKRIYEMYKESDYIEGVGVNGTALLLQIADDGYSSLTRPYLMSWGNIWWWMLGKETACSVHFIYKNTVIHRVIVNPYGSITIKQ